MNLTDVIRDVTASFNQSLGDPIRGVRRGGLTPETFGRGGSTGWRVPGLGIITRGKSTRLRGTFDVCEN